MFKTLPCKPGATNLIPGPERSHVPQEKYASAPAQEWESLVGRRLWGRTESDTIEAT